MSKKCCFTGHRDISADQIEFVKSELRKQICLAIKDGYTHFISGMADGSDLIFAEIVAETKADNPNIMLEAALPYRKRLDTNKKEFNRLIALCDEVYVVTERYSYSCFKRRNMYMVEKCQKVIAVYDGRNNGGTEFTIRYAKNKGKEIYIIYVTNPEK